MTDFKTKYSEGQKLIAEAKKHEEGTYKHKKAVGDMKSTFE